MYRISALVEDRDDAEFLLSCLRGTAATNSIKLLGDHHKMFEVVPKSRSEFESESLHSESDKLFLG